MAENARDLVDMIQVVDSPRDEELFEGDSAELRMQPGKSQLCARQRQTAKILEVRCSNRRKRVEQLLYVAQVGTLIDDRGGRYAVLRFQEGNGDPTIVTFTLDGFKALAARIAQTTALFDDEDYWRNHQR